MISIKKWWMMMYDDNLLRFYYHDCCCFIYFYLFIPRSFSFAFRISFFLFAFTCQSWSLLCLSFALTQFSFERFEQFFSLSLLSAKWLPARKMLIIIEFLSHLDRKKSGSRRGLHGTNVHFRLGPSYEIPNSFRSGGIPCFPHFYSQEDFQKEKKSFDVIHSARKFHFRILFLF